jgi:pimeloyl-ACP methyl ester carboxylesterase
VTRQVRLRPRSWPGGSHAGRATTSIERHGPAFVRVTRVGAPAANADEPDADRAGDDRVTFVLVHGVGLSGTYLVPLADDLSRHGEVLLVDLPGFGDLPTADIPPGVESLAALVHSVVDRAGVSDPVLVGHSMGAQIAVELLASRPETYRRGVLVGPPVNAAERRAGIQLFRYLQSAVHESHTLAEIATRTYLTARTSWVARVLPALIDYPIEDRIRTCAGDDGLRILRGEFDRLVPIEWADRLAELAGAPPAQTVVGAAHGVVIRYRDDVVAAAVSLMTAAERAGGPAVKPGSASDGGTDLSESAGVRTA